MPPSPDAKKITAAQQPQILAKHGMELQQLFRTIDIDNSGTIEPAELARALKSQLNRSDAEVAAMISAVDLNHDGEISWPEFETAFGHLAASGTSLTSLLKEWQSLGAGVCVGSDLSGMAAAPTGVPLWRFAFAGSAGAVASRFATAPLEKVTMLMQVSGKSGLSATLGTLSHVWRSAGVAGLWAGAWANSVRVALFGGLVCVGYSQSLALTPADDEIDAMEPLWRGSCGALAGLVATGFTHPLDVIRTRLTLQSPDSAVRHTGSIAHAARSIVSSEGGRALWRYIQGAMSTQARTRCLLTAPAAPYLLPAVAALTSSLFEPSCG